MQDATVCSNKKSSADDNKSDVPKTNLLRPFHVRWAEYNKARDRIFLNDSSSNSSRSRSACRMNSYWQRLKGFRKYVVSSVVYKGSDIRPYANLQILEKSYLSLLDSGANKSCVGGIFAQQILSDSSLKFKKFFGNVRTADGKSQQVVGSISLMVTYNNKTLSIDFLIVPSIKQEVICGMDFWNTFGIQISSDAFINEVEADEVEDALPLTKSERKLLNTAIAAFPSFDKEGLGNTTLVEHTINTRDAQAIKQRYYPISPAMEKLLCTEIDRMLSMGVIEEALESSWSSPGILIVKPGKVRFCLDSRRLNEVTVKDSYPIPNIDGILARLPPVHCISKIDLKDAFWQVSLSEDSRPKTAFTVPNRPLYQFRRMPFGLCNSPQTMCRLMDQVIPYTMKTHVLVYLDDLLVVSQSLEEHIAHLLEVASNLRKAGLTINVGKSHFGLSNVKYLGYVVGHGTLSVDPDKVKAVREYPVPKSARHVKIFLGMSGWYQRFLANYACLTFHLTELLSTKKAFNWNELAQAAFECVKVKLTTAPCLINPNYNKPFIVQCDACRYGTGGLLAQMDENGDERPIAFTSKKLNKAQRNYTVTEQECLAVVRAIQKYRPYIEGQEFKVVTDHASLKWLMRQKDLSGRLARWAVKLQGYTFTIEHRKGRDNVVADALSRGFDEDECAEIDIEVLPPIDINSDAFDSTEYQAFRDEILKTDLPDYKVMEKYIYYRVDYEDGNEDQSESWKLVVPFELREQILKSAHDVPSAAHGGIAKTVERVRRHFFWPGLMAQVRNYVLECELCKTSKTPTQVLRPPMGQMAESVRPFQRLYIDLIGPFPRTKKGNIGVLIILDHFTKFTFLAPLKKFNSKLIIEYLKERIFDCFGVPETMVSDNGSQFKSKEFEAFLVKYGVSHVCTAVYSPQSNASERVNRSINEALRSYLRKDQRSWDVYLSSINNALRNSIHQTIGKSPYFVVFGQQMLSHGSEYKTLKKLGLLIEGSTKLHRDDQFAVLRDAIKEKMKATYDKNVRTYNLRSRERKFDVGQKVIRRNFCQSSLLKYFNAKLAPTGVKALVKEKLGNAYYILEDCDGKSRGTYHAKDIWT